jgi:hypothetical protein
MPSSGTYGFGKRSSLIELELPTVDEETGEHHKILVKRPDPMLMVEAGILDDFDSLTALVGLKINEIEGKPSSVQSDAESLKAFAQNKQAILDGMKLMDKMVCAIVGRPAVRRPVVYDEKSGQPKLTERGEEIPLGDSEAERANEFTEGGGVYTDEIPDENKMFILNYAVGGTRDIEQFREGVQSTMAVMADEPELPFASI